MNTYTGGNFSEKSLAEGNTFGSTRCTRNKDRAIPANVISDVNSSYPKPI